MEMEDLINHLLINKEVHDFTQDEDIIGSLKKYIDQSKIIMLGIDMFYGISDTSQWQKHHVRHYILIEGYDEIEHMIYLLETGESGYKEYYLPYEDIILAAGNFNNESYIYEVNDTMECEMMNVPVMKRNAEKIIKSIDLVLMHLGDIWHVQENVLDSMRDEIEAHIRSIRNRQHVNRLLFEKTYKRKDVSEYIEFFDKLTESYEVLYQDILNAFVQCDYYKKEAEIKERFSILLRSEQKIWEKFVADVQNDDLKQGI